ncbi:MAG: SpoIIE family protein phosphatase [Spirochaetia bacterium]|nr:SpoIIE family protein phosphatase [Spirochaetia bacterium]
MRPGLRVTRSRIITFLLVVFWAFATEACTDKLPGTSIDNGWEVLDSTKWNGPLGSDVPPPVAHPEKFPWVPVTQGTRPKGPDAVFRVPLPRLATNEPALFVPKNTFSFRVYVDGREIYGFSDRSQFAPGRFLGWIWHLIRLPGNPKQPYAYFQIHTDIPIGFPVPVVGERDALFEQLIVVDNLPSLAVVTICFLLAVVFAAAAVRRPEGFYASLALLYGALGWWLLNVNPAGQLILPTAPWRLITEYITLYIAPAGALFFLESVIPGGRWKTTHYMAWGFLGYAAAALLLDTAGLFPLYRTLIPFDLLMLAAIALFVLRVIRGALRGQPEAKILAIGIACMVIFTLNDIMLILGLLSRFITVNAMRLHWGTLGFILSMAGTAVYRMGSLHRQVKEHAAALETSNQELAGMKDHLQDLVTERTNHLNQAMAELKVRDTQMQTELSLASHIQNQLLVKLPIELPMMSPRMTMHGWYKPMHMISGDFYDAAETPGGRIAILLADVSGHGVPAALIMTMVKAFFQEAVLTLESPAEIMAHLNNRLEKDLSRSGNYVTACMLVIAQDNSVQYANAAHRPAFFYKAGSGKEEWLDADGMILGAFAAKAEDYQVRRFNCAKGDQLFLYTDGIVERRGGDREHFGDAGLRSFLASVQGLPPEQTIERLKETMAAFAGKDEADDDITFLCLQFY